MLCDTSVKVSVYCQVPLMSARLGSVPARQAKRTPPTMAAAPSRASGRDSGVRPMLYRRDGPGTVKEPPSEGDAHPCAEPYTPRIESDGCDPHVQRLPPVTVEPGADRRAEQPAGARADRPPEDAFQLALDRSDRLRAAIVTQLPLQHADGDEPAHDPPGDESRGDAVAPVSHLEGRHGGPRHPHRPCPRRRFDPQPVAVSDLHPADDGRGRDLRPDDAHDGLALGAERARGLRRRHAGAVELGRNAGAGIGALEVAQPAVVQVRDERGDGPHPFPARWPGAPHGRVEVFDEELVDARARRIRAEQNGGWIAAGHGISSRSLPNDTTGAGGCRSPDHLRGCWSGRGGRVAEGGGSLNRYRD